MLIGTTAGIITTIITTHGASVIHIACGIIRIHHTGIIPGIRGIHLIVLWCITKIPGSITAGIAVIIYLPIVIVRITLITCLCKMATGTFTIIITRARIATVFLILVRTRITPPRYVPSIATAVVIPVLGVQELAAAAAVHVPRVIKQGLF